MQTAQHLPAKRLISRNRLCHNTLRFQRKIVQIRVLRDQDFSSFKLLKNRNRKLIKMFTKEDKGKT